MRQPAGYSLGRDPDIVVQGAICGTPRMGLDGLWGGERRGVRNSDE